MTGTYCVTESSPLVFLRQPHPLILFTDPSSSVFEVMFAHKALGRLFQNLTPHVARNLISGPNVFMANLHTLFLFQYCPGP